jgi:hypothetical protein
VRVWFTPSVSSNETPTHWPAGQSDPDTVIIEPTVSRVELTESWAEKFVGGGIVVVVEATQQGGAVCVGVPDEAVRLVDFTGVLLRTALEAHPARKIPIARRAMIRLTTALLICRTHSPPTSDHICP